MRRSYLLVAAILALPVVALANVALPSTFGFAAAGYVYHVTMWLTFVAVVVCEALVLRRMLPVTWARAFVLASSVNVASSLYGVLVWDPIGYLIIIGSSVIILYLLGRGSRYSVKRVCFLATAPVALVIPWTFLTFNHGVEPWAFWGGLALAFLLTVVLETVALDVLTKSETRAAVPLMMNIPSYCLLIVVMFALNIVPSNNPMYSNTYYRIVGMEAIRSGETEKLMQMVEQTRGNLLGKDPDQYLIYFQLQMAEELQKRSHHAEAASILKWLRENSQVIRGEDYFVEGVVKHLADLERATSPTLTRRP